VALFAANNPMFEFKEESDEEESDDDRERPYEI